MLYKPKYCCQCGEKIERIDWKLWSSRRFCEFCETEVGHYDWMPRLVLGLGIFLGVFGFGNYFLSSETKPEIVSRQSFHQPVLKTKLAETKAEISGKDRGRKVFEDSAETENIEPSLDKEEIAPVKRVAAPDKRIEQIRVPQKDSTEPVYFCGAETKKGTPCSRRVKGGGRCWQHPGREAILPEEELIANR